MKMMLLQLQCTVLVSCEKGHYGFFVLSLLVDYMILVAYPSAVWEYIIILRCSIMYNLFFKFYCR